MKRYTLSLALIFSLLTSSVIAQPVSLLLNGSFETTLGFPAAQGEIYRALGWGNCNGNTTWPYGSPDLFHVSGTAPVKLPNTVAGTVGPFEGSACAGFITSNGLVSDFREYLSYHLDFPMIAGKNYIVEFNVSNGSANWYGKRGSDGIGVAFTMTQPVQIQHEVLPIIPQIEITAITHHTAWTTYSFSYTSTQAFEYLTIGNFRGDINTNFADFTTGQEIAYYFLDMVSVTLVSPLAAEVIALRQTENEEALELTWHVPADASGSQFVLERSLDQQRFTNVHNFGTSPSPDADVYFTDAEALAGLTYFYRLRQLSADGELLYSPMVEASFGSKERFVAGEIYPNPVQDRFSLAFTAAEEGVLALELLDASGRKVFETSQSLAVGDEDPRFELPAGIAAGVYQAKFNFEGLPFAKKVLVTRAI